MPNGELNERQALFVKEYRIDQNGKQAAIRSGYSPKTAEQSASRLLRSVKVQAALQGDRDAQVARLEPYDINADRVMQELAIIGFGVMGSFYDKDSLRLQEVPEMDEVSQRKLSSIKVTRERTTTTTDGITEVSVEESTVELKVWDKLGALRQMGQSLGMFVERLAVTSDISLLEVTRAIEAREREEKAKAEAIDAEVVPG